MSGSYDHVPTSLAGNRHAAELRITASLARIAPTQTSLTSPHVRTAADQLAALRHDPDAREQLRGIPVVGHGGIDERRDPLVEVLRRERQAERAGGAWCESW